MVVGEAVGPPGGGDVAHAVAPGAQGVDRGLAQDDLARGREGLAVDEALVRARQVEVVGGAGAQVVADLAAVAAEDLAARAADRDGHRAVEQLVSALAKPAARLELPPRGRREPHAERAVGEANAEVRHELGVEEAPLVQVRAELGALLAGLVVVGDDLPVEDRPLGPLLDRAGERLGAEAPRGPGAEEPGRLVGEELLQELADRRVKAQVLLPHHPVDHRPAPLTGAHAVEQALLLGDHQGRGVVRMAVAAADEVAADAPQVDPRAGHEGGDGDLALDPLEQVVGDAGHRGLLRLHPVKPPAEETGRSSSVASLEISFL